MSDENDHMMFAVPSVVVLKLETGELHLFDKYQYGFGDAKRPLDEERVKAAGFEILGEL